METLRKSLEENISTNKNFIQNSKTFTYKKCR